MKLKELIKNASSTEASTQASSKGPSTAAGVASRNGEVVDAPPSNSVDALATKNDIQSKCNSWEVEFIKEHHRKPKRSERPPEIEALYKRLDSVSRRLSPCVFPFMSCCIDALTLIQTGEKLAVEKEWGTSYEQWRW